MNTLGKSLRILKGGLSATLYADLKNGIKAYGVHIMSKTNKLARIQPFNEVDFVEVNPIPEILDGDADALIETWEIERTESYFYLSGRNETTYIEMTFWYNKVTRVQKESQRKHTCLDANRMDRPSWARGINTHNKSLNYK